MTITVLKHNVSIVNVPINLIKPCHSNFKVATQKNTFKIHVRVRYEAKKDLSSGTYIKHYKIAQLYVKMSLAKVIGR